MRPANPTKQEVEEAKGEGVRREAGWGMGEGVKAADRRKRDWANPLSHYPPQARIVRKPVRPFESSDFH